MFGKWWLCLLMVLSLVVMGGVAGPAVAASQSAECADLVAYTDALMAVGEEIDAEEESGPDMDAMETWTEADYDEALAFYDTILERLRAISPPATAAEFHQTFLEGIELFQTMMETMKSAGPFAVLAFLQPIEELNTRLGDQALPLEEACDVALFDHDDDGEPEVGLGNAVASPAASPVAPSAGETAPIGTTVQTSDAFSLTVVSVDPDALAAVQEANPGSVPPDGFQFVNVEIELGHVREDKDTFELENLVVLGPTGVAYSAVNNSCGFVNGPLSSGEYGGMLTMSGHVCWVIASSDVDGLRLYDASQPEDERVYLSLSPADAGDEGGFADAVKSAVPEFGTPEAGG
jgi:hypothetical protein